MSNEVAPVRERVLVVVFILWELGWFALGSYNGFVSGFFYAGMFGIGSILIAYLLFALIRYIVFGKYPED